MATVRQREGTARSLGNSQDYPSSKRRSPSSARTDAPPTPLCGRTPIKTCHVGLTWRVLILIWEQKEDKSGC